MSIAATVLELLRKSSRGGGVQILPPPPGRVNPRPGRAFYITHPGRGGSMRPPWRFETKRGVVALREKDQLIAFDEYSRLVAYFFGPRSTFDLVMTGQRSIFGEIDVFFNFKIQ